MSLQLSSSGCLLLLVGAALQRATGSTQASFSLRLTVKKDVLDPMKITDAKGNVTEITRDTKGNAIEIKNAKEEKIMLEYNTRGQVTKITDALGHEVILRYDTLGRLTEVEDALHRKITQVLDTAGSLNGQP